MCAGARDSNPGRAGVPQQRGGPAGRRRRRALRERAVRARARLPRRQVRAHISTFTYTIPFLTFYTLLYADAIC